MQDGPRESTAYYDPYSHPGLKCICDHMIFTGRNPKSLLVKSNGCKSMLEPGSAPNIVGGEGIRIGVHGSGLEEVF